MIKVYFVSENSIKDIVFDATKVHGIVYNWTNRADLESHPGGYTGQTVVGIDLRNLTKSKRCVEFTSFWQPYSGRKINEARLVLPQDAWECKILCVVEGDYWEEVVREVLRLEEKYIHELDCVERGYNMTYGGEHGYVNVWKYMATVFRLRKITCYNKEDDISLLKIDKSKFPSTLHTFFRYLYKVPNSGILDESQFIDAFNSNKYIFHSTIELGDEIGVSVVNFLDLSEEDQKQIKNTKKNKIATINGSVYMNRKMLSILSKLSNCEFLCSHYEIPELGITIKTGEHFSRFYGVTNFRPCFRVNNRIIEGNMVCEITQYASRRHAEVLNIHTYQDICWCTNNGYGQYKDGYAWSYIQSLFDDIVDEQ